MSAPIGRLWGRRAADDTPDGSQVAGPMPGDPLSQSEAAPADGPDATALESLPSDVDADAALPEQPVLLTPVGTARQIHVGDVLPPARRGWPVSLLRLPAVPKRAILAAGVCAGLVAPTLARHLATRLLLGPGTKSAGPLGGTLEITRIVYQGPGTAEAMSSLIKALTSARR